VRSDVKAAAPWPKPQPGEPPLRPAQIFDPPQAIAITMVEVPDGPPRRFIWRRKEFEIVRAEGPERIAQEWWRAPNSQARDYYRIEDGEGRRFWVFRSGAYGGDSQPGWYLHGVFA
jgi:protein ImuB